MRKNVHSSGSKRATLAVALSAMCLVVFGASADDAHADEAAIEAIEKLSKKAMESYDLLDYEDAKKLLNKALAVAKTKDIGSNKAVAKVHLNLGIIYSSDDVKDIEAARLEFINAVKIDPSIEIDPSYTTEERISLLDGVKDEFGGEAAAEAVDCESVEGILHEIIDTAEVGVERAITAHVGSEVGPTKVSLHYRQHGVEGASTDYVEVKMSNDEGCKFSAAIPGSKIVSGGLIHYYVAAYDKTGRVIAKKGGSGSPNIIEANAGGAFGGGDNDNPLGTGSGGEITKGTDTPSRTRFFISVNTGTGGAYVTGETEQEQAPVNCCFAPALLHVIPELGYYLNDKTSVSFAFRAGFPIGANIDRHATLAPAGFIRLRRSMSDDGTGLQLSGVLGGGIVRQTVKLQIEAAPGEDTDITAIGPILLGGGAGYMVKAGGPLRLLAEVNLLAGLPVIGELGSAPNLNFGVQIDINVGVMLAF